MPKAAYNTACPIPLEGHDPPTAAHTLRSRTAASAVAFKLTVMREQLSGPVRAQRA